MCGYCGCATNDEAVDTRPTARGGGAADLRGNPLEAAAGGAEAHRHDPDEAGDAVPPDHVHAHTYVHAHTHEEDAHVLHLGKQVLDKNARLAERVRGILLGKGVAAINLVSSPGSGKTALLERSARDLGLRAAVLVGDLATDRDAARLNAAGIQAVQITTGNVCHLDAHMILHGFEHLDLGALDVLFFENVGNLVCPASFDLGEDRRVVLTAVTEGEDKPRKYPTIFQGADLALITKIDIAEVVGCDMAELRRSITDVAPAARILELSSRADIDVDGWLAYVHEVVAAKRAIAL